MSSGLSLWRSFSPLTRLSAQITSFTFTSLVFSRSFSSTTLRCDDEQLQQQKPKDEGWFSTAKLPDMPSLPDLPSLPTFELPSLPNMPELPSFDGFEDLRKSMTEFKDKFDYVIREVSGDEGSLYRTLVDKDRFDAKLHPEIDLDATIRLEAESVGRESLPHIEKGWLRDRKRTAAVAFAKYIGEDEVDPEDLPVIGIAASGGGYRAMVNLAGSIKGAKEAGILDCVSYLASISGAIAKANVQEPFLTPSILDYFSGPPTDRYLLASPAFKADINLVDIYGLLVSARLFRPDGKRKPDSADLKISEQRRYCADGEASLPLPLYNLVWHNVPIEAAKAKEESSETETKQGESKADEAHPKQVSDRWLWFEASPFEVGSEEIGAWCPTYAFGRKFDNGQSVERQPELQLTVLNGLFASAFTATLFQYIAEVRPLLQTLGTGIFGQISTLLDTYKADLLRLHPVPPAAVPNFARGLGDRLRKDAPKELHEAETIGLLDAGAFCNLPYMPLFRRHCDVIIALDASADSQDVWFDRAEKYAAARELSGWPRVVYPDKAPSDTSQQAVAVEPANDMAKQASASTKTTKMQGGETQEGKGTMAERVPSPEAELEVEPPLGRCNIWVGSTDERKSRLMDPTEEDVASRDGIALAYFPLKGDEQFDNPAEVWSTWRFGYKPEETDALLSLAERNFRSGDAHLRTLLRGVWQRKRRARLGDDRHV